MNHIRSLWHTITAIVSVIALTLSMTATAYAADKRFDDVPHDAWYHDAVMTVTEMGLFSGTDSTHFSPNTHLTRGMFITVMWRYHGSPEGYRNPFADVYDSDFYAKAAAWANASGIVQGVDANHFAPNNTLTREQMTAIMYRYGETLGRGTNTEGDLSQYMDRDKITDYAVASMKWATGLKLLHVENGMLRPLAPTTRAEAAAMWAGFAALDPDTEPTPTPAPANGKSAYELAVENGFVGDLDAWLASLVGPKGEDGIDGTNGLNGKDGINGADGKDGVDGKDGTNGIDGKSAYELAADNGFVGDITAWLASLVGPKGDKGEDGKDGKDGINGKDGKSAYELAADNGFVGDITAWLASLVGPKGDKGDKGEDGADGKDGATPIIGENGNWWIDGTDTGVYAGTVQQEFVYASAYGITPGNVDTEKFHSMLQDTSIQNKTILFADGEYCFSSTINLTSDVSLQGGADTILRLAPESSSTSLLYISGADNVKLSDLTLQGSNTQKPTAKGSRTGIWIDSCRSINIENVDIAGWDLYGLYGKTMSSYGTAAEGKFFKQLQVLNTRFYNNYCGTYLDYRCEYTQLLNCVFGENHIGSINCGGNNMYTSCMWNSNDYGFILNNSGSNPAHGGCNSSTFNHNSYPIQVNDCVNGWTFDGCQVFYGKVELLNSKGVIFNGSIFGSCTIRGAGSQKNTNMITDSYFLTDSAQILSGNDGSIYISNCLPDHLQQTPAATPVPSDTRIVYTASAGVTPKALSTNAYSAATSHTVAANTQMDYVDFVVCGANASSVIPGINIWAVDQSSGTVAEQLFAAESRSVFYSEDLASYAVRFKLDRAFDFPTCFIVQCERINGVSIAYYQASASDAAWLKGDIPPSIGDPITPNSNAVPMYAVYRAASN